MEVLDSIPIKLDLEVVLKRMHVRSKTETIVNNVRN